MLLAHPDLVPLYLARQGAGGPKAQHLGETMLTLLADGASWAMPSDTRRRVLIIYTIGFTAFATHPPMEPDEDRELAAGEMLGSFSSGLRWLLAGIRASSPSQTTASSVEGGVRLGFDDPPAVRRER